MVAPLHRLLLGPEHNRFGQSLTVAFALVLCLSTFLAYALDLFVVAGGVVFLPQDAALVGFLGAAVVGYESAGLAFAWVAAFAPLFGFNAEWGLLGLSSHDFLGKLAFVFDPETLAIYTIAAVVVGSLGFAAGVFVHRGSRRLAADDRRQDA